MSNYPIVINNRMPYDIDGGVLLLWTSTASLITANQTQITNVNSENNNDNISVSNSYGDFQVILVFPELRNITQYFLNMSVTPTTIEYSVDTTTGFDGTWSAIDQLGTTNSTNTFTDFRFPSTITLNSGNPVKAIRFVGQESNIKIKNLHIYGNKANSSDRLVFWDAVENNELNPNYLNFENVLRNSSETKSFRIKNISSTKIAVNVEILANSPTIISPLIEQQFTFSINNIDYGSSIYINSLLSDSISDIIYIKRNTLINAKLGAQTLRINAIPQAWIQV